MFVGLTILCECVLVMKRRRFFQTKYGHFQCKVISFGFANTPAIFQAYISGTLEEYLDMSVLAYLDDIQDFSKNHKKNTNHVCLYLEKLREAELYAKLEKCEFHTQKVNFFGFEITSHGVHIEKSRFDTINDWLKPQKVKDVGIFRRFANVYRRFISRYYM